MTDFVRIPTGDPDYPALLVTASEVRDAITSRYQLCGWEVTRAGQIEPCMKEAVALRCDETNGGVGLVCKHHAKRLLVPLDYITHVAAGVSAVKETNR